METKQLTERTRPYPHFKFPDEITITFERLTGESVFWHGAIVHSYIARCENYGWFPADILMGVTERKFDASHEKSLYHGASQGVNLGTASILITVEKKENAISTLQEYGYNVIEII